MIRWAIDPNLVVNGGEILVETGGVKDDHVFTRLAVVLVLVLLVVVLVEGENNVPGSDKVDVLVVVASAQVEAACSLGPGPILSGDRDAEGRGVWVASGESRVGQGDGIKEPIACLSHNARLPDFYVVVVDTATVDGLAGFEGDGAAPLEAERPELDANPDDGRTGGLSDFDDAESLDTGPASCSGHGEGGRLNRGPKRRREGGHPAP